MNKKIIFLAFAVLALIFSGNAVSAQETSDAESQSDLTPTTVDCFDYYKFQSVQVNVGTDKDSYIPQEEVVFSGTLENQNDYPVVDGLVFVRIGQKNPAYTEEGNFIVDEFAAIKDISLASQEKQETRFKWAVPKNLAGGEYQADFFFSVGKKFNLGGLPFTNEVVVNSADFTVNSSTAGSVSFLKSETKVNGEKYNHIGNLPMIEPGKSVDVSQPVSNSFNEDESVRVTYDLFFWDGLNESDKIDSKQENIIIPAGKTSTLNYTIPEMKDSVYLLKITAFARGQKSIINVRLASDQVHPRLNYPAITKFPLQKGDKVTIFSCFHNTAYKVAKGQVRVELFDQDDRIIGKMEYEGDITGAMQAAKNNFVSPADYTWLKLAATLTDENGKVIDHYETIYDCSGINSDQCGNFSKNQSGVKSLEGGQSDKADQADKIKSVIIIFAIILISLIMILIFVKKREARKNRAILFLLVFLGGLFLAGPTGMEAYNDKSKTVSEKYKIEKFEKFRDNWKITVLRVEGIASITHKVKMTEGDYSVKTGDPISFECDPEKPFFNATGWMNDSPYGAWTDSLDSKCSGGGSWLHVSLETQSQLANNVNAIKPACSVSSNDKNIIDCKDMKCVAKNSGEATLTVNVPSAKGIACARWLTGIFRYSAERLSFSPVAFSWKIKVIDDNNQNLSVIKSGSGSGVVVSSPAGVDGSAINCGTDCSKDYAKNTLVTLSAITDAGSEFPSSGGWSANCAPVPGNPKKCITTMDQSKTVTAQFNASGEDTYPLNVYMQCNGTGKITSAEGKIDCGNGNNRCSNRFNVGDSVSLNASPSKGSEASWASGCTSSSGTSCRRTIVAGSNNIYVNFCKEEECKRNNCACAKSTCKGDTCMDCGTPCEGTQDCSWKEVAP